MSDEQQLLIGRLVVKHKTANERVNSLQAQANEIAGALRDVAKALEQEQIPYGFSTFVAAYSDRDI